MEKSGYGKLLGVKKDSKLIFYGHVKDIRSKYTKKIRALSRETPDVKTEKINFYVTFFQLTV